MLPKISCISKKNRNFSKSRRAVVIEDLDNLANLLYDVSHEISKDFPDSMDFALLLQTARLNASSDHIHSILACDKKINRDIVRPAMLALLYIFNIKALAQTTTIQPATLEIGMNEHHAKYNQVWQQYCREIGPITVVTASSQKPVSPDCVKDLSSSPG